jgi:hypothetical protein
LAFSEQEIAFQLKFLGERGEGTPFDQLGPHHGEGSFLGVGRFEEEEIADREIENGISEEFQDLIGHLFGMVGLINK